MTNDDFDPRAELEAKRAELQRRLGVLSAPIDSDATIGFGKRIGDGTIQAIAQMEDAGAAATLATTLDEVNQALARLDDDTYGTCVVCGRPIDPDRLEFRPWSTACVEHADAASAR